MLTFAEEILILLLGDRDGELFTRVPGDNLSCALAGAVLLDLSFAGRIDTDPERLVVIDPTPTGNVILDSTLARLAARDPQVSTRTWIGDLSVKDAAGIRESVLQSLVARVLRLSRDVSGGPTSSPDRREAAARRSGRSRDVSGTSCSPTTSPIHETSPLSASRTPAISSAMSSRTKT